MADKTITVWVDFDCSYAWIKDSTDKTPSVGDALVYRPDGFRDPIKVSKDLEEAFEKWIREYENNYDNKTFDWVDFNTRGLELSRRLKREVGNKYNVQYSKPYEDPNHDVDETTPIP